jgi:hypothetical protein
LHIPNNKLRLCIAHGPPQCLLQLALLHALQLRIIDVVIVVTLSSVLLLLLRRAHAWHEVVLQHRSVHGAWQLPEAVIEHRVRAHLAGFALPKVGENLQAEAA